MAFAAFDRQRSAAPLAEINMVPLIDVMLVLLVIFIVTAPLLTHAVKLDLPKASSQPSVMKPERIDFAINAGGQRFWNGEPVSREQAAEIGSYADGVIVGSALVSALGGGVDAVSALTAELAQGVRQRVSA